MTELRTTTLQGVFMEVYGIGVLLSGASGVGKSELALVLINRGHKLIADDIVYVLRAPPPNPEDKPTLLGSCPELLQDFLEVRGLGILNIRAIFGEESIKKSAPLELIVNVVSMSDRELNAIDRIHGQQAPREIFDTHIPEVSLPLITGRNLAVLVEAAVRNQQLKMTGYNAGEDFVRRQSQHLD